MTYVASHSAQNPTKVNLTLKRLKAGSRARQHSPPPPMETIYLIFFVSSTDFFRLSCQFIFELFSLRYTLELNLFSDRIIKIEQAATGCYTIQGKFFPLF